MAGLTQEQRERFAQQRCENDHRFDGLNYPTPEGICPFCAMPELRYRISGAEQLELQRPGLHPSLTAFEPSSLR